MDERRAIALLDQLTLEEKVALLAGSKTWVSTPIPRLEIPALKLCDGPNAARGDAMRGVPAACFPVGSAMAATWNPELIEAIGIALGEEAQTKDVQVLLGPTINLHRHPLGGRHFECYSEDPVLTGTIACAFIRGVQSQGVAACAKHFICNDSEFERHTINSKVDARTLRELYLRPFEMAVKEAGVWTLMSAYNRVNGTFASSNEALLDGVLRQEWGFDGFVVSDWGAALETIGNANAGMDLEMPGPSKTRGAKLIEAVQAGQVAQYKIDDSVERILRITARTGKFTSADTPERADNRAEHQQLARRAAAECMVVLKNETPANGHGPLLPLTKIDQQTIALVGPNAEHGQIQGGGSSAVFPHYQVMPHTALAGRAGRVIQATGCHNHKYIPNVPQGQLSLPDSENDGMRMQSFTSGDLSGEPAVTNTLSGRTSPWGFIPLGHPGREAALFGDSGTFSSRIETDYQATTTGSHTVGLLSSGLCRLFWDNDELIDNWTTQTPGDAFFGFGSTEQRQTVQLVAGTKYRMRFEFQGGGKRMLQGIRFGVMPTPAGDPLAEATAAAADADIAIVVAGSNSDWETEGNDRANLDLPGAQNELISTIAKTNPNTIVVLNTGAPVAMPWLSDVAAVVQAWLPGQEFGNGLVDVLSGTVDASGRLPTTFPRKLEDSPAFAHYPGENGVVHYDEGLGMGYRGYIANKTQPLFAFGHGLSYTTWSLGATQVETQGQGSTRSIRIETALSNVGQRQGQQVLQCYVSDETNSVPQPAFALATSAKVDAAAGATTSVELEVKPGSLRYWDTAKDCWAFPPGQYRLHLGFAADNILQEHLVSLS